MKMHFHRDCTAWCTISKASAEMPTEAGVMQLCEWKTHIAPVIIFFYFE